MAKLSKVEQTRGRILDAALACYAEKGIDQTTLEEVARQAGIGRTTLYRYVSSKDDLLGQVILRDAEQQREEMSVLTRYHDNLADSLVDSTVYVIRGRRNRPINTLLFGDEQSALIARLNISPGSFYDIAAQQLAPLFEKAREAGQLRDGVTLENLSQWVARITLSLVNYPEEFLEDEQALREFLRLFLVPSVVKDNA